jgi:hypothetical protein
LLAEKADLAQGAAHHGSHKATWRRRLLFKDLKTALDLVGWWSPLSAFASALAWGAWAMISGLPLPVIVLGVVCLIPAAAYLVLLPSFVRLLARNYISEKL